MAEPKGAPEEESVEDKPAEATENSVSTTERSLARDVYDWAVTAYGTPKRGNGITEIIPNSVFETGCQAPGGRWMKPAESDIRRLEAAKTDLLPQLGPVSAVDLNLRTCGIYEGLKDQPVLHPAWDETLPLQNLEVRRFRISPETLLFAPERLESAPTTYGLPIPQVEDRAILAFSKVGRYNVYTLVSDIDTQSRLGIADNSGLSAIMPEDLQKEAETFLSSIVLQVPEKGIGVTPTEQRIQGRAGLPTHATLGPARRGHAWRFQCANYLWDSVSVRFRHREGVCNSSYQPHAGA
jgi:hypothetical protein